MQSSRRSGGPVLAAALIALAGCAAANRGQPQDLAAKLQAEGASPVDVPAYLIAPNGTFRTNGLTPEPWGDTN